jgi:hypothetical protein
MKTKRKPLSERQKIMKYIQRYFAALKPGQEFHGSTLADYCLKRAGSERKYHATVIQYMSQLRRQGVIDYACLHREKSLFAKL